MVKFFCQCLLNTPRIAIQDIKYFELSKLHVKDTTLKLFSLLQRRKEHVAFGFYRRDTDRLFVCFVSKHVSRPSSISESCGVHEGRLLGRNSLRSGREVQLGCKRRSVSQKGGESWPLRTSN